MYVIAKLAAGAFLLLLQCLRGLPVVYSHAESAISLRRPVSYYSSGTYRTADYTLVFDICEFDSINADLVAAKAISRDNESLELVFWQTKEGKYRLDLGDQREIIDFGMEKSGWKRVILAACWKEKTVKVCNLVQDICIVVEIQDTAGENRTEMPISPLTAQVREIFTLSACFPYTELKKYTKDVPPFFSECTAMRVSRLDACHPTCSTCSGSTFSECLSCYPGFALSALSTCLPCDPTCETCDLPSDSTKCLTCVGTAIVTDPPAACICPTDSYWTTSPYQCTLCAAVCLTCSGTATTCTNCKGNASLDGATCKCDLFFFADPDASQCSPCQSSCKTCGNSGDCLTCVSPAMWFYTTQLCYCTENYYTLTTPRNCLPCHSTCFSCFGGLITDCKSCWMNAELLNGGPRAPCRCISAFFPDPDAKSCKPCYASCLTCNGSSPSNCQTCISNATFAGGNCPCDQGFFLVQVPASCTTCDPTCLDCQGGTGNECVSCSSGDASMIGSAGHGYCQCNQGFFPDLTAANCTPCHISCLACTGPDSSMCTKCHIKAILNSISPNTCSCLDGFYPSTNSNNCQPCNLTCLTCSGPLDSECLSCSLPFTLSGGVCTCPANSSPADCITCHATCQSCSGAGAAHCSSCMADAEMQGAQPSNCICISGYLPSPESDNCVPCYNGCLSCYSPAEADCYECYSSASLVGGKAPSSCACDSGYFPDTDIINCSACHSSCFTCTGPGDTECSVCYPNAMENGGTCACSPMYFPSPNVAKCQACHYTCLACTGTSLIDCTSCFPDATPQSACICDSHYYPNPASNNCSICAEICTTCDSGSTNNCLSCYSGAGLSLGILRGQCACLLHHYTLSNAAHCLPCHPSCYSCWNGDVPDCLSCYDYASLANGTRSECICDLRYFPNNHAGQCENCHYSCVKCDSASASDCTACDPNATLSAGTCTCVTGYYMTTNGPVCYTCDTSCISCSNGSSCNTCYSNATPTFSGGTNYCKCVLGYYPAPNAVNCELCHSTCKGCTGPLATNCSQCFPCENLSSGSCNCNPTCFRLTSTSNCEPCHPTCAGCSDGNGPSYCTLCYSNASIVGTSPNACLCNVRYYPSPSSASCLPCDSLCLTCSGPLQCTLCDQHSSPQAVPNSGVCSCDQYYFFQSNLCVRCHSSCLSCNSALATGCLSCGANSSVASPPDVCICTSGYYMETTLPNCYLCDPICSQCAFAGSSGCLACKGTAVLLTSPGPSPCFCANNYNLNPITGQCDYCALPCFTCSGSSPKACTACWPWASLVPEGGPGFCECEIGRFPAPTARTCTPCDRTCRKCYDPTPTACYDCYDFAQLSGTACICSARAYPDPDSSSCRLCALTCSTCLGPYSHSCTSCNYAGYLQGPAPSLCLCSPGFFPDPDASQCSACLEVCASCPDAVTCSSCRANAELGQDFLCYCISRAMGLPDASNCILCPHGCQSCFDIGCLECIAGYYLLQFACYDRCPLGYEAALHAYCAVADMSPPVPVLTVLESNALSISFDKDMNFTLSTGDFSIEVVTSSGDLSPVTWSEPEFHTSSNFTVHLAFQSSYLPPHSQANFTFLSPAQVLSVQLVPITTVWLASTLHAFGPQPVNSTTTLRDSAVARNTAAAVQGVAAVTVVNSLVSGSSGGLISLINQLQLITYLSMTKLPLTEDFAGTLAAMNVGNLLPNPLTQYISLNLTVEKAISPPDYVENYGIDTVLFLSNACGFLLVTSLLLFSYLPTHFLAKSSNSTIASYCRKRMKSLTFSTPLLAYLSSYLDLSLFSLLQVVQMRSSLVSVYAWTSLLMACLFVLLTWVTPIALVVFTVANRAKMMSRSDSVFNERWGVLFQSLVQSDKASILAFYSLFVTRRLLLVGTLVLFPDFLSLFAVLNSSISLLSILYMAITSPYAEKLDQVEGVALEIGTALVYFQACAFALPLSSAVKGVLGTVGTWSVRVVVAVNFLFSLYRAIRAVLEVFRQYRVRAKYVFQDTRSSVNTRDAFEVPGSTEQRGRVWWSSRNSPY